MDKKLLSTTELLAVDPDTLPAEDLALVAKSVAVSKGGINEIVKSLKKLEDSVNRRAIKEFRVELDGEYKTVHGTFKHKETEQVSCAAGAMPKLLQLCMERHLKDGMDVSDAFFLVSNFRPRKAAFDDWADDTLPEGVKRVKLPTFTFTKSK